MSSTMNQEFWPDANIANATPVNVSAVTGITKIPYTFTQASQPVNDIASTLAQRGDRYGKFTGHARITQELKKVLVESKNWKILTPDQKESLEMICHKMGRILNGDPNYDDSWIDIAGYAKLVADRLSSGQET